MTQHKRGSTVTVGWQTVVQMVSTPPAHSNGARLPFWGASRTCGPARWLALL